MWGLSIRGDYKPTPLCQNRQALDQKVFGEHLPSFSLGSDKPQPRPAACLTDRQAAKSAERAKGPRSGPSSYPRSLGRRARAGRRRPLAWGILFTAHISLLQEPHSCDLASSQLPTMGGGLRPACSFLKFLFWACACPSAFPWLRGSGPRPGG